MQHRYDVRQGRSLHQVNLAPATDPVVSSSGGRGLLLREGGGGHVLAALHGRALLLQTEGSEAAVGSTTDGMSQVHLVIWGTDVNVQDTKYKFAEFLQTFVDDLPEDDTAPPVSSVEPLYMACMEEVGGCRPLEGACVLAVVPACVPVPSTRSMLWRSPSWHLTVPT